ncbi:MAG: PP2C family protein-serine/threonine phosphatase [Balneolaceae bacterium]|nr:PP2C family protein-serine/threonine phosphatase [Balneolaceae bacterium]
MTTFSDSTKRDWGLVIAGLLGLGLFFWLYAEYHPLSISNIQLSEADAIQKSQEIFEGFGYSSDIEPNARLLADSRLLDSIQVKSDLHQYRHNEDLKKHLPAYYWETSFFTGGSQVDNPLLDSDQPNVIQVLLDEGGGLISFQNERNFVPENSFRPDLLRKILGVEFTGSALPDSLPLSRLQFELEENGEDARAEGIQETINLDQVTYLGRASAERIARYYLEQSYWSIQLPSLTDIESVSVNGTVAARATFTTIDNDSLGFPFTIEMTLLATGQLISMTHAFQGNPPAEMSWEQLIGNIRIGATLLGIFWILIMLIIRFRMRLIDMKAAILVAVLAGFTVPFIVLMQFLHNFIYSFGTFSGSFVVTMLTILGILAAITSIIFFMVTSIADSITRERWVRKLRTIDLIRIGHFASRPVGLALLRGTLYSFVISGLWALLLAINTGYLTVPNEFYGSRQYLPGIGITLSNLLEVFIISEAIFLILIPYFKSNKRPALSIIAMSVFIFGLMNPLSMDIGPLSTQIIMLGMLGLAAGIIYYFEDYLTVFITLFFTVGFLNSPSGWLVDYSPDVYVFYVHVVIVAVAIIAGVYSIRKGKLNRDIPEFIPEYIQELAQEERIKQELQIARKVQQSFLPLSTPDFRGLDIAAVCKPAYETGGDYYDFIELDGDRLAVTIGDVSGKGIQAAFYMTFTKGVLHALCNEFESTIDVLSKTNTLFRNNADKGTFVSLIFGVVDLKNSLFRFSRAGHNPLLYFNNEEKKLHEHTPLGIGLGMAGGDTFSKNTMEETIQLSTGDILIMFTDGVVEAVDQNHAFYGEKRLYELVRKNSDLCSEELIKVIMDDLEKFSEGVSQHDDMTMLIIRKQ